MMLLWYSLCQSVSTSQFWSNFRPIPALYADIPAVYSEILPPSSTVGLIYFYHIIIKNKISFVGDGNLFYFDDD